MTTTGLGNTDLCRKFELFGEPNAWQKSVCNHGQYGPVRKSMKEGVVTATSNTASDSLQTIDPMNPQGKATKKACCRCCKRRKAQNSTNSKHDDNHFVSVPFRKYVTDNHHSPIDGDDYLGLRVEVLSNYYEKKLPILHKFTIMWELLLIACSIIAFFIAAFGFSQWSAMGAVAAGFILSWRSFTQSNKTLAMYSSTLEQVNKMTMMYESLTPIEKTTSASIRKLVDTCEDIFQAEWEAWSSTTMKLETLKNENKDASGNNQMNPEKQKKKL
jgi:hypothetical protein